MKRVYQIVHTIGDWGEEFPEDRVYTDFEELQRRLTRQGFERNGLHTGEEPGETKRYRFDREIDYKDDNTGLYVVELEVVKD